MRLVITGSKGLIGSTLCEHLVRREHEVLRLQRDSRAPLNWDPAAGRLNALPAVEGVVHLAGAGIADQRWSAARKRLIHDSREQGTRLLCEHLAAMAQPPAVLVCASAVGFYGETGDTPHRAGDPPGEGFLATVCRDWEAACEPARAAGIRVVNLRFGMVLAADGGALATMLPAFRWGLGGRLGSGRQWISWIGLTDAVRVVEAALDEPAYQGPIDAVAPQPLPQRDFARSLGRVLRRPTLAPLPATAVSLLFGEMGRALLLGSSRVPGDRLAERGFTWQEAELEACLANELAGVGREPD